MRTRSTRCQPSSRYTDAGEDPHSFHIQEGPFLCIMISLCRWKTVRIRGRLTVEAGVRARQAVLVAIVAVDVELAHTIHALQFLETVEGDLTRAGHELQQLGSLFLIEGADGTPEPLDLGRGSGIVVVLGVVLPFIHVDLGQTGDQKLELLLVEDGNQIRWNDFMEACRKN